MKYKHFLMSALFSSAGLVAGTAQAAVDMDAILEAEYQGLEAAMRTRLSTSS